ncbi:MAG: hypothetical protein IJV35_02250 [Neisseriaceae bacterium]|nr:hypothetical protein [Neisseriaceae bacterium]
MVGWVFDPPLSMVGWAFLPTVCKNIVGWVSNPPKTNIFRQPELLSGSLKNK